MTVENLSVILYNRLRLMDVSLWDTDGKLLFEQDVAKEGVSSEDADKAWFMALENIKDLFPKLWDSYQRSHGKKVEYEKVPWENIKFLNGTTNGDTYVLTFSIEGDDVTITCKDTDLLTPDFILRKMLFYSRRMIDCPYTTKSGQQNWIPGAVLPWLNAIGMKTTERENPLENTMDCILQFASNPLWKENLGLIAFDQTREPIRDGDFVFIPFTGCYEYVKKALGVDAGPRYLSIALEDLGAVPKRKGKTKKRFYAINWNVLHAKTLQAGIGEDDEDSGGGEADVSKQWDGLDDSLRESERLGVSEETGMATGKTEGPVPDNDDSRSGVRLSKSEAGNPSDEIPF